MSRKPATRKAAARKPAKGSVSGTPHAPTQPSPRSAPEAQPPTEARRPPTDPTDPTDPTERATGETVPTEPAAPPDPTLDRLLRIAGAVVATGLGALTGLYEAFLSPLWLPQVSTRAPLALVLALVGNPLLAWFAYATTGRRAAAFLPALAWSAVWFIGASRTAEGDLVITSTNWVGLATLFLGPAAFAGGIYLSVLRRRRPP